MGENGTLIKGVYRPAYSTRRPITGDHSEQDQILLVKMTKYTGIGFCVYRRSYLLCPPRNSTSVPVEENQVNFSGRGQGKKEGLSPDNFVGFRAVRDPSWL